MLIAMISDRKIRILDTALKDYIKTGAPITSERLYCEYDFGIKPAMIRLELNDLSEAGYLVQMHHSGGRLPTDKAYRYFASRFLEDIDFPSRSQYASTRVSTLLNWLKNDEEERFIEEVAKYLNSFGLGYALQDSITYESGLAALFEQLQTTSRNDLLGVVRDLEKLRERVYEVSEEWFEDTLWPKVFVGENLLTKSNQLSLIAQKVDYNNSSLIVVAVGPKRMDYQKSLRLFSNLNPKKKSKKTSENYGRKRK